MDDASLDQLENEIKKKRIIFIFLLFSYQQGMPKFLNAISPRLLFILKSLRNTFYTK
jgi:hypothetical protein